LSWAGRINLIRCVKEFCWLQSSGEMIGQKSKWGDHWPLQWPGERGPYWGQRFGGRDGEMWLDLVHFCKSNLQDLLMDWK
jgi:hypothetical protein